MNTFESNHVRFHYHSDFSGYVEIVHGKKTFAVPGEAIVELVLECFLKPRLIDEIEDFDMADWLGRRKKG